MSSAPPTEKSDHVTITGTILGQNLPNLYATRKIWCWGKADIAGLRQAIDKEKWNDVLECESVETAWIRWRAKPLYHAEQLIPRRRVHATIKPHPWMTPELRQEIKAKHSLYKSFKRTHISDAWEEFRKQRNRVGKLLKIAKSNFIEQNVCK